MLGGEAKKGPENHRAGCNENFSGKYLLSPADSTSSSLVFSCPACHFLAHS